MCAVGVAAWLSLAPVAGAAAMRSPFFASTSFVNQRVDTSAFTLDPSSSTIVNGLNELVNGISGVAGGHGAFVSDDHYAYPVYVVDSAIPAGQPGYTPRVPVTVTYAPQAPFHASLQNLINALGGVPIPSYAQPATGTDQIIDVYDSGTDTFYEFWHFCPKNPATVDPAGGSFSIKAACQSRSGQSSLVGTQASAETGGILQHASQSEGYYSDRAYPGYSMWNWGALGSNIADFAGVATIAELQSGHIDHAVGMMLPPASGGLKDASGNLLYHGTYCTAKWVFPAQQRGAGYTPNTAADCIPEGTRLRLALTDTQINALNLTPMARMYALAAAHYGVIVREADATAPSFERESPYSIYWKACPNGACSGGVPINPYTGHPFGDTSTPTSTSIFAGYRLFQVMSNFPWSKLQAQKMVTCTIPAGACPTVSISSPAAGATVTGTVTISGLPTPKTGAVIAGVQFKVDAVNVGAEDTTAPYSVSWDTSRMTKGAHQLTATTRDTSNRLSDTSPVRVTVG